MGPLFMRPMAAQRPPASASLGRMKPMVGSEARGDERAAAKPIEGLSAALGPYH